MFGSRDFTSCLLSLPLVLALTLPCTAQVSSTPGLTASEIGSLLYQADSFLLAANIDSARSVYVHVLHERKNSVPALTGLGKIALLDRKWSEALAMAKQSWDIDKGLILPHYIAAIAYRELGITQFRHADWRSSRDQFEWILHRDSTFLDALYQFALLERYADAPRHALALAHAQLALKPGMEGPCLGIYKLYTYFVATEDTSEIMPVFRMQPGSIPLFFAAEALRRKGDLPAAEHMLLDLLANPHDVCPQALHLALARLRMGQGDPVGAEREYIRSIQELHTSLGAMLLLQDVKYIISDAELEYYERLHSTQEQKGFFLTFWNFRNPSLALRGNLRLQEHISRRKVAEERYEYYGFRTQFNNPDNLSELSFPRAFALNEELNDMGLVYMRQGEPDDILRKNPSPFDDQELDDRLQPLKGEIRTKEGGELATQITDRFKHTQKDPSESWLYTATPETPRMIFHFQKRNTAENNWRLTLTPANDMLADELQQWDVRYRRLYEGRETDRAVAEKQVKKDSKSFVGYALTTEKQTWEKTKEIFRFPHSIDVFRAPGGQSLLDVSYAVPIGPLAHLLPDSVSAVPVEIGFSLIDARSEHAAVQLDTLQIGLSHRQAGVIIELIRYTVPPDSYAVSMHIRSLRSNILGTWRQTLRVRDYSRAGFSLSSIQYLRPSLEKGAISIEGVKVIQSPYETHLRTEPLYVYFQIYNLVPDLTGTTTFETECILVPEDERDPAKGVVIKKRQKTGKDETAAEFYPLDVHAVSPGRYTLFVRVTDAKRVATITAERALSIVQP